MRSFWSDPYLWVHLAGLAALPVLLVLCMVGLAVGDPLLPAWLEVLLVAAFGIAPVLWMQWQRPFYIFSLVAVALKPEQLTEDQRRLLTQFQSQGNRILALLVAIALFLLLRQIYSSAVIAAEVVPLPDGWRGVGLLLAAIAFLGSNLFAQVPASVLGVMLTSESAFADTAPQPVDQIRQQFTLLGLPVNQILPPVILEVPPQPSQTLSSSAAQRPISATETPVAPVDDLTSDIWGPEPTAESGAVEEPPPS